jgi:hypothetical protein
MEQNFRVQLVAFVEFLSDKKCLILPNALLSQQQHAFLAHLRWLFSLILSLENIIPSASS